MCRLRRTKCLNSGCPHMRPEALLSHPGVGVRQRLQMHQEYCHAPCQKQTQRVLVMRLQTNRNSLTKGIRAALLLP